MLKIDDELISELLADPAPRTLQLVRDALAELNFESSDGWQEHEYQLMVEVAALIAEMLDSRLLSLGVWAPDVRGDMNADCMDHLKFLREVEAELTGQGTKARYAGLRSRFKVALGNGFSYQFSTGDLSRIQGLINELRERISAQDGLEEEHRQRLLRRLEKLQGELHKKMSDLDRFWGLIGDAGVVLGKLGTDAKPIVDRIKDIADIVWQTQSRAEELPSGTKPPLIEDGRMNDRDGSPEV